MRKLAAIVLGMHRSGTSTASGMLYLLGFDIGKSLMGGNASNYKGFYENYRIMFFNESIFQLLHVNWHNTAVLTDDWWKLDMIQREKDRLRELIIDEFSMNNDIFLFKDPRLCVLLPLYLEVFQELDIEPRFILTNRNPDEVGLSLMSRDGFEARKAIRIWIDHVLKAEFYTRSHSRIFINFEKILMNPMSALEEILSIFPGNIKIDEETQRKIQLFVDPSMNHCKQKMIENDFDLLGKARQLYGFLTQLQGRAISSEESNKMDDCFSTFYRYYHEFKWPKIFVITPIHSFAEYLDQTINSVTSQDYPNLDYIIISKNPDDHTKEILLKSNYLISRWIDIPDGLPIDELGCQSIVEQKGLAINLQPGETFPHKRWVSKIVNRYSRSHALPGLIENFPDYLVKTFNVL